LSGGIDLNWFMKTFGPLIIGKLAQNSSSALPNLDSAARLHRQGTAT
jgi:hypothetical protein